MSEEVKELSYGQKSALEALSKRDEAAASLIAAEKDRVPVSAARSQLLKGAVAVIGNQAVIHAIWAGALVAVTWILVVRGWRG